MDSPLSLRMGQQANIGLTILPWILMPWYELFGGTSVVVKTCLMFSERGFLRGISKKTSDMHSSCSTSAYINVYIPLGLCIHKPFATHNVSHLSSLFNLFAWQFFSINVILHVLVLFFSLLIRRFALSLSSWQYVHSTVFVCGPGGSFLLSFSGHCFGLTSFSQIACNYLNIPLLGLQSSTLSICGVFVWFMFCNMPDSVYYFRIICPSSHSLII